MDNTVFDFAVHCTQWHAHHADFCCMAIMLMGSERVLRRGGKLVPERSRCFIESSSRNEAPQVQPRRGSGRRARPTRLSGAALASAALALLLTYSSSSPATALIQSLPFRGRSSLSQARVIGAGDAAGDSRCGVRCDRRRLGAAAGTRVATTSTRMVYGADENEGAPVDPFDEGKMAAQGQHVINW